MCTSINLTPCYTRNYNICHLRLVCSAQNTPSSAQITCASHLLQSFHLPKQIHLQGSQLVFATSLTDPLSKSWGFGGGIGLPQTLAFQDTICSLYDFLTFAPSFCAKLMM